MDIEQARKKVKTAEEEINKILIELYEETKLNIDDVSVNTRSHFIESENVPLVKTFVTKIKITI